MTELDPLNIENVKSNEAYSTNAMTPTGMTPIPPDEQEYVLDPADALATGPLQISLLHWSRISLPFNYLLVGILQGLIRPLLNVWPLDLGATEAQQSTLLQVASLPATFKILFGFWSDNVAIFGYRRKPYMLLGWILVTLCMHRLRQLDTFTQESIPSISLSFFGVGCGMWMSDVMADAVIAVLTRGETQKGHMQSTCYACRFFGIMCASPLATALYNRFGPDHVLNLIEYVPLGILPFVYFLEEDVSHQVAPLSVHLRELWTTVCSQAVWQPLAFVYAFNLLQISNAAWRQFLITSLDFTTADLNILLIVSYACLYVGTMVYKFFCLENMSWRRLYFYCICFNLVFSLGQLLLIHGWISEDLRFFFAAGDEAVSEFVTGLQFLPNAILMVSLCPPGSEGASYSMFTTFWNTALMLAIALSTRLLGIWDVKEETLAKGNVSGLSRLSLLTTGLQLSPILLLSWFPHGQEDLKKLDSRSSWIGGLGFLTVLFASLSYTFVVAVINIVQGGKS